MIHRLEIADATAPDGVAHLAVDLERPEAATAGDLAVLYLHGFGSRQVGEKSERFRTAFLARGVAFCSFDFRGHGDSTGSLFDLSLTRNLEDAAAVADWLAAQGLRRLVLIGSSMGGGAALWLALRRPAGIVAAVHIAPSLELDVGMAKLVGDDAMRRWQRDGRYRLAHDLVTSDLSWGLIEDLRSYDRDELVAGYAVPTLIFQGVHDISCDWRAACAFAATCPGAPVSVHLFGDGDHRLIDRLGELCDLTMLYLEYRELLPRASTA